MFHSRDNAVRVLIHTLEYPPLFAGHGIYLHRMVPSLRARGASAEVLTADFGRLPAVEAIDGVRVTRYGYHPAWRRHDLRGAVNTALALVRCRREFDVLHLNGFCDTVGLIGTVARLLGKGVVTQLVLLGSDDPETILREYRFPALRRWALLRAHHIVCISPQIRDACLRAGLPADRVVFVPQGVDTDRFRPATPAERIALRSRLGYEPADRVAVFVGAVVHRKGVDTLIDAWKTVQSAQPHARLVIVGPDRFSADTSDLSDLTAFVNEMKRLVADAGLRVSFVGRQDRVEDFLRAADLFVLPSRKEGFGNVIIEAHACGLPAVVTPMDGVASVTVQDGENGFIVDGAAELSAALIRLSGDPALTAKMAVSARQSARARFDAAHIAGEYVRLYQRSRGA